ncbi:uncharacterized protein LOC120292549 [Eucalyptus grandis]|uniref:uncharacterized protein LOC120292549 n=1 Tax=Eucalyptus grandis TaxID=71139 RepID=UPI00192EC56C|nr:uncharacterized protein LOC120292549 [Eucalyptus grandis]
MEKLQVLDITGLSFTSLPLSIELLENLKSLCLDQCRLEDVTIIGKLKGLQFLSFLDSTIARLPKEIGGLTELRFLDLTGCTELKVIEPGMLGNLVNLEELYMENSFDQWEAEDKVPRSNASLAELKNMKNLSTLSIAIPHSVNLLRDLPFGKLNMHKIQIGEVWDCLCMHKESRTLELKLDSSYLLLEEWVQKCLQRAQDLHLGGLQDGNDSIHDLCIEDAEAEDGDEIDDDPKVKSCKLRRLTLRNLPMITSFYKRADYPVDLFDAQQLVFLVTSIIMNSVGYSPFAVNEATSLEAITIERCQLIRKVFDLEGLTTNEEVEILSRLRELTLSDLSSLEYIWNKNPQRASCFQNLRTLKVQNCENLRFLFSSSMAKALKQIKEIEIVSCDKMEEIINVQEEELEEAKSADTLNFPILTFLSLEELPNLRTFSYEKYDIHYPSLTRLTISSCPKMMTFSSSERKQQLMRADIGLQQAFGHINSGLSLPVFFNEKVLFPRLEELKLSSMCRLKRIWHNQLPEESFCKLTSFTVELCENLSHVFPSNSMDRLQSLNKIEVVGCPSLEALFEWVCLSSEKRQTPLVLSALKKIKLWNLPRLRDVLKSDRKVNFKSPCLMEVDVRCCHSLPYLFSSATARSLRKLAILEVSVAITYGA